MTVTPPADAVLNPEVESAPGKRRFVPWFALGVVVGMLLFGGGYGGLWLLLRASDQASDNITRPVEDAANAFFEAVVNGDDAYGQLCVATSLDMTREQFERNQSVKRLTAYKLVGTDIGRTTVTVTVELTYANGNVETHLVPMAIENETWKVCGLPY